MTRESYTMRKRRTFRLFGKLFGFEYSFIFAKGKPYLERWIIYCGGTLRLHRFHDGDEPVLHDHPWWFVTFPLRGYWETYHFSSATATGTNPICRRWVAPFRFHFRKATHRHYILKPSRPVWTVVITGDVSRVWGFWPRPDEFVPYHEWSKRIDL